MEWNNEKTTLFIEDYHNSPELWNNKIADYKDNRLKNDKLKQLASKYECTVIELKKKIKNLRSAFHRERKKLQQSKKKSGSSPSKKAKWFAFDLLSFLLDVDQPRPTTSTASDDGEDSVNGDDFSASDTQDSQTEVSDKREGKSCEEGSDIGIAPKKNTGKKKRSKSPSDREEEAYRILKSACQRDECSTYGEHVANELRNQTPRARTIVKHLMNNILFEAGMGKYDTNASTRTSTPLENYENSYSEPPSVASACSHQSTFSGPTNSYVQPLDNFRNKTQREDLSAFPILSEFLVSNPLSE